MAVVVPRPKLSIKLPESEETSNGYTSNASPKASSSSGTPPPHAHAQAAAKVATPELRNRMGVNSPRLPHRPDLPDTETSTSSSSPPSANGTAKVLPPLPVSGSQKRIGAPPRVTLTKTRAANGQRNTKPRPKKEATLQLAKPNATSNGSKPANVVVKTAGSISTGTGVVRTDSSRSFANSPRIPHKVDHQAQASAAAPVAGPKRPTQPKPKAQQPAPTQLVTQVPRPQQQQYAPQPQQNGAYHQPQQQQHQPTPYASNNDAGGGLSGLVTQVSRDPPPQQAPIQRGPPTQPRRTTRSETEDLTPAKPKRRKGGKLRALSRRLCSCMMMERPAHAHAVPNDQAVYEIDPQVDDGGSSDEEEVSEADGLLGPKNPENRNKKTLVLDLDETLVHSSFKPVPNPDFIVPITIEKTVHRVYVMKRPGVDEFLQKVCQKYEVVVFTASLAKYANPLLNVLDPNHTIASRLFREACVLNMGIYVKDLQVLGRKLADTIIVDNSPPSYAFHPQNAIPIDSWFDDRLDRQLYDLLPVLVNHIADVRDVREHLDASKPISWLLQDAQERGVIDQKNQTVRD